jgi:hypothetical protein
MGLVGPQSMNSKHKKIEKCPRCGALDYLKEGLCFQCRRTLLVKRSIEKRRLTNGL